MHFFQETQPTKGFKKHQPCEMRLREVDHSVTDGEKARVHVLSWLTTSLLFVEKTQFALFVGSHGITGISLSKESRVKAATDV